MKIWLGLLKKEWLIMRWGIISLALVNVIVVLFGPILISRVFNVSQEFFTETLELAGIWLVFNVLTGVGVLLTSLSHEMKRPDAWLHSPVSMYQLVGAKAGFASAVTAFLLVLNGILVVMTFLSSNSVGMISVTDGLLFLLSVLIAIFLNSILFMAIGFMIWSIYQVIHSRMENLSGLVIMSLLFLGIVVGLSFSGKFGIGRMIANILQSIKDFGPVKLTDAIFYNGRISYLFTGIVPEGIIVSIGSLLVGGLFTVLLFVAGSMLFEKKVRL